MVIYSRRTNDAPVVSESGGDVDLTGGYSGAVFTAPLTLPNNSRIAGVEHFYQTTKPTVRGDGSVLVAGDRWWKIDTGEEWFWNGTYWLSSAFESTSNWVTGTTDLFRAQISGVVLVGLSPVFLDYMEIGIEDGGLTSVNNCLLSFSFDRWHTGSSNSGSTPPDIPAIQNINVFNILSGAWSSNAKISVGYLLPNVWARSLRMTRTFTGVRPGALGINIKTICRTAYL